jgi:hypothetical protein
MSNDDSKRSIFKEGVVSVENDPACDCHICYLPVTHRSLGPDAGLGWIANSQSRLRAKLRKMPRQGCYGATLCWTVARIGKGYRRVQRRSAQHHQQRERSYAQVRRKADAGRNRSTGRADQSPGQTITLFARSMHATSAIRGRVPPP